MAEQKTSWTEKWKAAQANERKRLKPMERKTTGDLVTNLTDAMNATLGGALEGSSMGAGAWAGGSAMAQATKNPWLTALGTLAGGLYGGYTGKQGRDVIADQTGYLQRPEELPEDRRSWGYMGESVGGALPVMAAPYIAAARGFTPPKIARSPLAAVSGQAPMGARLAQDLRSLPSRAADAIGNIPAQAVDAARRAPLATAGAELSSALMASQGAYAAEEADPGNAALRAVAEAGAGTLHPIGILRSAGRTGINTGKRVGAAFSEQGAKSMAGERLRKGIAMYGGDPEAVARQLLDAPAGPAAMAVDDPYLRLETGLLADRSPVAKRNLERIGKERSESTVAELKALTGADPQALRQRAAQRMSEFSTKLDDLWRGAKAKADIPITRDEPRARTEISHNAQELVQESLHAARGVEGQYWDNLRAVVGDTKIALSPEDQPGLLSAYRDEISQLLPAGESLPPILSENVELFGKNRDAVPLSDIIKFRGKMLKFARSTTDPNKQEYRGALLKMADAAEAEIEAAANATGDGAIRAALDDARGFSRELHDSFTRTFAGDTLSKTTTGEERIIPETILKRAFSAGREIGETQFKDLAGATAFLPDRGFGDPEAVTQMRGLQERYLRLMADEKRTGEGALNVNSLRKWMDNNQGTLDQFPAMRKDLEGAITAQNKFKALSRHYRKWTTPSARKGVFAELAKTEDPARLIAEKEASAAPRSEIFKLIRTAKRSGPGATEGLAASAVENELRKASAGGDVDFSALSQNLNDSVVLDELRKRGVINDTQFASMKRLANEGERVRNALQMSGITKAILDDGAPGQAEKLATQLTGANIGGMLAPGGSSLVAAGATSRALQNLAKKTPQKRMEAILEQGMLDKDFTAELILMSKSKVPMADRTGKIRAYLWQIGITDQDEEEGDE